jgi:hypothetical protein
MRLPSPSFLRRTPPVTIFLGPERFFVRIVPLAADAEPEQQVELALEALAPFPLPQLYWGFVLSANRASALVYAAHRRRFTPEEIKSWQQAALVVPAFLPLAGRPGTVPAVLVHQADNQLAGVAWRNPADELPAAVMVRGFPAEPSPEERNAFARDVAARAGVPGVQPRFVTGAPSVTLAGDTLGLHLGGSTGPGLEIPAGHLDHTDVRDREFLAERRERVRRGTVFWRVLLAGLATAGVACLLELGGLALHVRTRTQQSQVEARQPTVDRLETENTLAARVDELASQRLLPFEMLVVLNDKRPASVQFVRTTTQGSDTLEVEAQTANASDVTGFEQALHEAPAIAQVKTHDIRARDGVTTFVVTVTFHPEALRAATKSPV